jgi:hypothetical protein
MSTVIRQVGSSLGTQIGAAVVAGGVIAATGLPSEHAYTIAFGLAALAALASTACALLAIPAIDRGKRALDDVAA